MDYIRKVLSIVAYVTYTIGDNGTLKEGCDKCHAVGEGVADAHDDAGIIRRDIYVINEKSYMGGGG